MTAIPAAPATLGTNAATGLHCSPSGRVHLQRYCQPAPHLPHRRCHQLSGSAHRPRGLWELLHSSANVLSGAARAARWRRGSSIVWRRRGVESRGDDNRGVHGGRGDGGHVRSAVLVVGRRHGDAGGGNRVVGLGGDGVARRKGSVCRGRLVGGGANGGVWRGCGPAGVGWLHARRGVRARFL